MNSMESGKNTFLSRSSANSAHAGHRERLRRRALLEGIDDLRPHELLELLLYYAIPRRDVNALAHALDEQFGGVYGVLRADEGALAAVPGLGGRAARWLKRVSALCDAYALLRAEDRPMLGNLRCFREFARKYRPFAGGEAAWQFCLTYEGRLLLARPIAVGTAWAEPECLRAAVGDVVSSHAHSVLLAQFVDAALPVPDDYDLENTAAYATTLQRLDVPLLDHLLVGSEGDHSMRDRGELLMGGFSREVARVSERYMGPLLPARNLREGEDEDWLSFEDA